MIVNCTGSIRLKNLFLTVMWPKIFKIHWIRIRRHWDFLRSFIRKTLFKTLVLTRLNTCAHFWAFSATASTFWVTAVSLAMWCNAQILLDSPCFCFAKLKRFVRLIFFLLHFRYANVHGRCRSIHRKVLFYSNVSSHPKWVSLFRAQCGKA